MLIQLAWDGLENLNKYSEVLIPFENQSNTQNITYLFIYLFNIPFFEYFGMLQLSSKEFIPSSTLGFALCPVVPNKSSNALMLYMMETMVFENGIVSVGPYSLAANYGYISMKRFIVYLVLSSSIIFYYGNTVFLFTEETFWDWSAHQCL